MVFHIGYVKWFSISATCSCRPPGLDEIYKRVLQWSNLLLKVERSSELSEGRATLGAALEACDALATFVTRDDVKYLNWTKGPSYTDYQARGRQDTPVWRTAEIFRDQTKPITCRQGNSGVPCTARFGSWKAFSFHVKTRHSENPPYPRTKKNVKPEDPAYKTLGPVPQKKVKCEYCGLRVLSRKFNVSVRQCQLYASMCRHLLFSDPLGRRE